MDDEGLLSLVSDETNLFITEYAQRNNTADEGKMEDYRIISCLQESL